MRFNFSTIFGRRGSMGKQVFLIDRAHFEVEINGKVKRLVYDREIGEKTEGAVLDT